MKHSGDSKGVWVGHGSHRFLVGSLFGPPVFFLISRFSSFALCKRPLPASLYNSIANTCSKTRGAARIFLRGGLKLWKQKP